MENSPTTSASISGAEQKTPTASLMSPTLTVGESAISIQQQWPQKETDQAKIKFLKLEQMKRVQTAVKQSGFVPADLVDKEVCWFYQNLGIEDIYFASEPDQVICSHILSLYAAKLVSYIEDRNEININLVQELPDRALFIHTSKPGTIVPGEHVDHERTMDQRYLDAGEFRLETYRSHGIVSEKHDTQLRCYFLQRCKFPSTQPPTCSFSIESVADRSFLEKATPATLSLYNRLIREVGKRCGPVIEVYDTDCSWEKRLVIAYKTASTSGFFSSLSDLYHFYGLYSTRKYVEQFSNGTTIMSLYLSQHPRTPIDSPPLEEAMFQIMKESNLLYCIPINPLQHLFREKLLSVQEMIYGYSCLLFTQHFLNRLGSEYATLQRLLDATVPAHQDVLLRLKKRLRQDTWTRDHVLEIVLRYPELIKILYQNFAMTHYPGNRESSPLRTTISFARVLKGNSQLWNDSSQVRSEIHRTTAGDPQNFQVFETFLTFNDACEKCNFFTATKVSLAFRLDPSWLPESEYPMKPWLLYFVLGSEFQGFHLRFQQIARGGVRMIRSRNREAYGFNFRSLFDENYSLAATQQRKNKDLPEGGAKGTILLHSDYQSKSKEAFQKYVDSLLDLISSGDGESPGAIVETKVRDGEFLFLGPDEGSAEFMDWASEHARARSIPWWRSLTTGKGSHLGGVPHDRFGMTTHSIREYVKGIYRKVGVLDERSITKIQTGGPDGDLGSNEILLSCDRTIAIVDASGVAYDPLGLDRSVLVSLAKKRIPIVNFPTDRLSPGGFLVPIDARQVSIPGIDAPIDGVSFRNGFHLSKWAEADLFVPCGGRPESVDAGNWRRLLKDDANGTPKFRWIVEGANLFFTQEARLGLEAAGVIIFKDASANKGGVTSSSLEVLASFALSEETFTREMQVPIGAEPSLLYLGFVDAIQQVIHRNAELEFEAIWREHRITGLPRSIISDQLSLAIIQLDREIQENSLLDDEAFCCSVLEEAVPQVLVRAVAGGVKEIHQKLPAAYVRAFVGSYLGSRFVYLSSSSKSQQFSFFEFMLKYYQRLIRYK